MKQRLLAILAALFVPASAFAQTSWTPLITAESFTGIRTDVMTAIAGITFIVLLIAGAGLLYRVITR